MAEDVGFRGTYPDGSFCQQFNDSTVRLKHVGSNRHLTETSGPDTDHRLVLSAVEEEYISIDIWSVGCQNTMNGPAVHLWSGTDPDPVPLEWTVEECKQECGAFNYLLHYIEGASNDRFYFHRDGAHNQFYFNARGRDCKTRYAVPGARVGMSDVEVAMKELQNTDEALRFSVECWSGRCAAKED